jgi:hypothetical protein
MNLGTWSNPVQITNRAEAGAIVDEILSLIETPENKLKNGFTHLYNGEPIPPRREYNPAAPPAKPKVNKRGREYSIRRMAALLTPALNQIARPEPKSAGDQRTGRKKANI